ncbi:MAG: Uma2 family endonuclease [Phycisphaerae bacterium]
MRTHSSIAPEMLAGEYLFRRYDATVADYDRAADEDTRLELIDGILIMHSPANVRHEDLFAFMLVLLRGYAQATDTGRAFGSRTPLHLSDDRRVEPDLLFILNENLGRLGDVALTGPADVVIEILSPATRGYDLVEKRSLYADAGVPEYWIIDPAESRFLVDRPAGKQVAELSEGCYTSEVLKAFRLNVDWLWQDPLPDSQTCLAQIVKG